jgi:hypothetical protein
MKIDVDQLLDEAMTDEAKFEELSDLLKTAKVGAKVADIILNTAKHDLAIAIAAMGNSGIVPMMLAGMSLAFTMGRLYGRSELIQELEKK